MLKHDDLTLALRYLKKTRGITYTCESNEELGTQTWTIQGAAPITPAQMADIVEEAKADEQWQNVRNKRDRLLLESDYTQLGDFTGDAALWRTYRQALRDVTSQSDPFNITYPDKP